MKKRNRNILLGLLLGGLIISILYLFNTEKLYSEFWLQRKLDNYSLVEPSDNVNLSTKTLTYRFYDDSGIDIEISLISNGYISIGLYKWFKDNPNNRTYIFKANKKEIDNLINNFMNSYSKSEFTNIDDHIGGHFSTLTFKENTLKDQIEIGFYNVIPDKKFKALKNKMVDLGNDVISELDEY
jgi:hypothetical protein